MTDWDALVSFEDWAGKLDELLEEANRKLAAGENALATQRRLRQFRLRTPAGHRFEKLNRIAARTVTDIAQHNVAESIERIAARSTELDDLVLELRSAVTEGERRAAIINLESTTTIATSLTEATGALKHLRDTFQTDINPEEVAKRVEAAINAVIRLRDAIERAS